MRNKQLKQWYVNQLRLHKYCTWWAIYGLVHSEYFKNNEYPDKRSDVIRRLRRLQKRLNGKSLGITTCHAKKTKLQSSKDFYSSGAWKELRYLALKNSMGCCQLSGARASDGIILHVDHIIPRSVDPSKALDLGNLQIMCEDCNFGKSNYDSVNWKQLWNIE